MSVLKNGINCSYALLVILQTFLPYACYVQCYQLSLKQEFDACNSTEVSQQT